MTAATVRNTTLPVLGFLVGAAVLLPRRPEPKVQCSPGGREDQRYWCSVQLDYPPEQPDYSWSVEGECQAESLSGETIVLTSGSGDMEKRCTTHAIVRERVNGPIIAKTTDTTVVFVPSTRSDSSDVSNIPRAREAIPIRQPGAPRIAFDPPDEKLRTVADAAPVSGKVQGPTLSAYIVAFYTQTPAGWALQGKVIPDRGTGSWDLYAAFGSAYAVVLARRPFNPEPSLQTLPSPGKDVVAVKVIK